MKQDKERRALADQLRPRLARIGQSLRREAASSPLTTAQMAVLNLILLGKPLRISDLARAEAVTLPTMTQVINRMVDAGWVIRTAPAGTYNNYVDITKLGRKLAAEVAAARNTALERRLKHVAPEDYSKLTAIIPLLDQMFQRETWKEPPVRKIR